MIKKIHCKCIKTFNDNYIFVPCESIKDNELLNNYIHKSIDYELDCVFDLRKEIINNHLKGEIYFYIAFLKDKDTYVTLNNLEGETFLYSFDRIKNKKELEYKIDVNSNMIGIKNKYIFIGQKNTDFRKIAYECQHCFFNSVSKSGTGFYGFNLVSSKNINYTYCHLIISDKPLYNNDRLPTYQESLLIDSTNLPNYYEIHPSAPPMESAPYLD